MKRASLSTSLELQQHYVVLTSSQQSLLGKKITMATFKSIVKIDIRYYNHFVLYQVRPIWCSGRVYIFQMRLQVPMKQLLSITRGQWEKPSAETVKSRVALQANRRLFFMGLNDHNFVIEKRWQKHIVHPSYSQSLIGKDLTHFTSKGFYVIAKRYQTRKYFPILLTAL